VVAAALVAVGALGSFGPPTLAAGGQQDPVDGRGVAPDLATGGPVDPIPYVFPTDGGTGGGGGSADPSIALRPAFQMAARPSKKTAIKDQWSRDKQVWANPDGTFTLDAKQNLNYKLADGSWVPIDLSLVQTDGAFAPVAAPTKLKLTASAGDGTLAALTGDDGTVSLRLPDPVTGARVNDALAFDRPAGQPDVFVQPTDTGFEFGATLADAATASRIDFVLDPGSLQASIGKDGYTIDLATKDPTASKGAVGVISAPSVLDAAHREADLQYVSVALVIQADGTYLLSYQIDPTWLAAKERTFPVTLDPSVCIRSGDTGCSSTASDIWYGAGDAGHPTKAAAYVDSSTTNYMHVGWYLGTGDPWGQTRSALYFPGATLPDGAVVTSSTLSVRELINYSGGTTARIYARLMDKPSGWTIDTSSASWNSLAGAINGAYDSPAVPPCDSGGTDCWVNLDVTKIARAWYTRRGADWKPNAGIQLRYVTENTAQANWDTSFYSAREATVTARPILSITYEVPAFDLDFDAALGPTYAPSTMVLDKPTVLPIVIKNNSGYSFDSNYKIGYRFMDVKGAVKQSGTASLSGTIATGTSGTTGITITPSSSSGLTYGQYTLRLDVAKVVGSDTLYASDWAQPHLYYSRNKRVLTSDSTRWSGSSVIDRDEFGIRITNGQGSGGQPKSVPTGDGGQVGINLATRNVTYQNDTGIAIADRIGVGLTYGYNSKDAVLCATTTYLGILGACGWYTNWDERVVAGSADGAYTYYSPAGDAYLTDSDFDGQLVGAPNQLSRKRVTLFDENRPTSGGTFVSAAGESIPPFSGPNVVKVPSNTTTTLAGFVDGASGREVNLNAYRWVNFALRTGGGATPATSTAICFTIHNKNSGLLKDVCAVAGPYFNTGQAQVYWSPDTVLANWSSHGFDLWGIVSGNFGTFTTFGKKTDDYFISAVYIKSAGSNSGSTYVDGVELTPYRPWRMNITSNVTNWTSGSSTYNNSEVISSTFGGVQVTGATECSGTCFSSYGIVESIGGGNFDTMNSLLSAPYLAWWWKKAGGRAAALTLCFTDNRSGGLGEITYYAGAAAPALGGDCPTLGPADRHFVQLSPHIPGHYTREIRNILEDARQILNFYLDDDPGVTSTSVPTNGPSADDVKWTGLRLEPTDGQYLLFTRPELNSTPLPPNMNRYADWNANKDDLNYAGVVDSSDGPKDDFVAENADGTSHYFNRDGLLTRIVTKSGAELDLEWSYGASSGPSNYTLVAIHAPSDNTDDGGSTVYRHYLAFSKAAITGFNQLTFTEKLGTSALLITGRRADFFIATTTGTTWGVNDLVKVGPARHNASTCGTQPAGCDEFRYSTTTSHKLSVTGDGRWDGGSGGASLGLNWASGDATEIQDRSHSSAVLLRVINWDRDNFSGTRAISPLYVRSLWQDAPAIAAGYAMHTDLSPDGSETVEYIRQGPCASGDCVANRPLGSNADLVGKRAREVAFDGLAHVTSVTTYRCPGVSAGGCTGTTALESVERRGTNAGAKVDNYADALAASEVAWTQSSDQYFASMRDSGGLNPDLYRTDYEYNGVNSPIVVRSPSFDRVTDYSGTLKATEGLTDYWRLNDAASPLVDVVNSANNATGTSLTYGAAGPLARDTSNKAITLDGWSSKATSPAAINGGAYTIEAWAMPTPGWSDMLIAGRWSANSGARLFVDSGGTFAFSHNATTISAASAGFSPDVNRWYFLVATWDGATARLYVDGNQVASGAVTGSTGQPATTFNIGSYGSTGYFSGSIDEVALRNVAIDRSVVRAHYDAGRGAATVRAETTYGSHSSMSSWSHLDADPSQSATQLIANGDFEEGLNGWNTNHFVVLTDPSAVTAASGAEAIALTSTYYTDELAQAVPGQRVHFQLSGMVTPGAQLSYRVDYWQISTASWHPLVPLASITSTSWTSAAYQYTVPVSDTTGLLKVKIFNGAGTATAYADSVLLVVAWQAWTYKPIAQYYHGGSGRNAYIADSIVETTSSIGSAPNAAVRVDKLTYAIEATHQALWPTKNVQNYLDGTQGPGPEEDVTTLVTYDSWGRPLTSTDPDGIVSTTVYDATNLTDVAQTKDGLSNPTAMTYDAVGNRLSTTTPLGRVTSATYDARNQQLTTTTPDGVVGHTDYDNYGRSTASWSNWVDGNPATGGGADDYLTTYGYDAYGRVIQKDVDCGSVGTCSTGGLDARTVSSYDLLGNVVASTAYAGAAGTSPRTTTNYFETTGSSPTLSRTTASGVQLPIAPSAGPAPLCPGSATAYCNSASVWKFNGAWISAIDMNGRSFATTDAYGIVTLSDLDLAGRPVIVTANYDATLGASSDTNVVTRTEYDLAGDPIVIWDAAGRRDTHLLDALGRVLEVHRLDSTGTEYAYQTTQFKYSGRVDRAFDGSAWTQTLYDGAGRAIKTVANWDQNGNAGMTLDAMEGTVGSWSIGSSGFFTTTVASTKTDDTDSAGNEYTTVAPVSGAGRLHVATHGTNANDGVWLDLSGPTYQSGHVYKAAIDLTTSAAVSLTAYLGQDSSGGSYGSLAIPSSPTTWTRYTVSWTASSNLTTPIHFAVSKAAAGTTQMYLDNLVVWDSTAGSTDKGIVSSLTDYDSDGEITASVLPPGDPATERPLVTTVAFDPAGRTVESVTNGSSGAYAAAILTTASLAAYFPLNERLGIAAADKTGGNSLVSSAIPTLGIAGGIDEARTATRFTGSNGYLSRGSNATSLTTGVSMEAWVRTDTTPSGTVIVASNGTSAASWGIAIDSSGDAAGFTQNAGFTTLSSTKVVTDGAWHEIILTRTGSTWAMTVDGSAQTLSNNTTSPGTPGAGFSIGAWSDGTRLFTGEADEVSVYITDISGSTATAHWSAGRRTDTTTALTTRNAYDRLGRVTDAWAPDLVRTKAVYDRLGDQTETWANYRNGVTTGGTADDDIRSTYAYDVAGELIGYCPAVQVKLGSCDPTNAGNVQAWHYVFDALGRQTKTIPPVNQSVAALTTSETVYESGGHIGETCQYPAGTSCGSVNSRHLNFTYDNLGRPLTKKTWDRAGAGDVLKFTKTLTWNADGSPASVSEASPTNDTLTYVYDNAGRISQFKRGATVLTAYSYTPATSTIATRTDGTQGLIAFSYDWARRETIINPPDTYVTGNVTRTYRLDGLLATQTFPSSITETLAYDAVKRPVSIDLGSSHSISQTFDRAGRVTSDGRSLGISGDAGTNTQSFTYDNLSRLTGSTGLAINRSYAYDLDGNRTSRVEGSTTTVFTYDRTDETVNQTIGTTKTYTYDTYGNLTTSADNANALTTYAYDEASRLTTINPPSSGQITFAIDALDRNLNRSVGGTLNDTYAYVGPKDVSWQTDTTTPTSGLLDADGSRLAVKSNTTVSWLVFDLHGSVAALCTAGGSTLSDAYRYDGFGQQIQSAGSATNPWRYRGLLNVGANWDIGALLDMGARDYAPQLGAFTQLDSVQGSAANPMSMNRYLYALANPATLVDPDGHMPLPCGGGCGADHTSVSAPPCISSICSTGSTGPFKPPTKPQSPTKPKSPTKLGPTCDTSCDKFGGPHLLDPITFDELGASCGRQPRPTGIFVGGPCTQYWQTYDAQQTAFVEYCQSHRSQCEALAKQKLLGLVGTGIGLAGAACALSPCLEAVIAACATKVSLCRSLMAAAGEEEDATAAAEEGIFASLGDFTGLETDKVHTIMVGDNTVELLFESVEVQGKTLVINDFGVNASGGAFSFGTASLRAVLDEVVAAAQQQGYDQVVFNGTRISGMGVTRPWTMTLP
jgi:RHS repeat-associated protein